MMGRIESRSGGGEEMVRRKHEPREKMTFETSGRSLEGREKSGKRRLAHSTYHRVREEGSVLLRKRTDQNDQDGQRE